jgi:hypothetical protein
MIRHPRITIERVIVKTCGLATPAEKLRLSLP